MAEIPSAPASRHSTGVLCVTLGGTIDAEPYPNPASPPEYARMLPESAIPAALQALKAEGHSTAVRWHHLPPEDSKKITRSQLEALRDVILAAPEPRVVVFHGTDTMPYHARVLQEWLDACPADGQRKEVVFAGAMCPLANDFAPEWIATLPVRAATDGTTEPDYQQARADQYHFTAPEHRVSDAWATLPTALLAPVPAYSPTTTQVAICVQGQWFNPAYTEKDIARSRMIEHPADRWIGLQKPQPVRGCTQV